MKVLHVIGLVCLAALPLAAGAGEPVDHPDYEVVKAVIEDSVGWAMTKDLDRLLQIFANDDDLLVWWVGTSGSAEGIDDIKEMARTIWMTDDFKATRFEFRDLKIHFSQDGRVAWFSCRLDDCGTWKGREGCTNDVRSTGVLEKRGEQWTIVQNHASWPVDRIPDDVWERLVERRRQAAAGG